MLAITIDDRCLSILNNINLEKMKVRGGGSDHDDVIFCLEGGGVSRDDGR